MSSRPLFLAWVLLLLATGCEGRGDSGPPWKTTASGLRYRVLEPGQEGMSPVANDVVSVHYTGRFVNGEVFDSSLTRGAPFTFMLGQGRVIAGWDEGVALMTVGAKFQFHVPWALAYGESGSPPRIRPRTDLRFDVELLEVEPGPRFAPLDPSRRRETPSGLAYEVLQAGEGPSPRAGQAVRMRFVLWSPAGDLIACTQTDELHVAGPVEEMKLGRLEPPFLAEAVLFMRPGGRYRFEVSGEAGVGDRQVHPRLPAGSPSLWDLEIVEVVDLPAFPASDPARTRTTPSGLRYEVLREGGARTPVGSETVTVHYSGWLEDGTLFDSSYRRAEPITESLARFVRGWAEGVRLMGEGAVHRLTIPPDLAYGNRPPAGSGIPAGATLVFQVELLRIGE